MGLFYQQRLTQFTQGIVKKLTTLMDVRLVRTFSQLLITLLRFRHRNKGLLLSELGAHLLSARQAPVGTKRISNLLRCPYWSHTLIQKGIRAKAQTFYEQFHQQGQRVLILWQGRLCGSWPMIRGRAMASRLTDRPKLIARAPPPFMDFHHDIGIDIAKATLDWAVYSPKGTQLQCQTPNSVEGVKIGLQNLKSLSNWLPAEAVFCMEHTGIYNAHLLQYLDKLHLPIWLESALQIKQAARRPVAWYAREKD